jgi:pyruvate formate lyase activating enzyme
VKHVVNLLPYHNIASGKYQKLEIPYYEGDMDEPSENEIQKAVEIFEKYDLTTEIGG